MTQTIRLYHGDSLEVLKEIPDDSLGGLISDPPYGLEFMGSEWDAPWKYKFSGVGFKSFVSLPSFSSSRNPVCQICHKQKRGARRCTCEVPRFDEIQQRVQDRQKFQEWCAVWLLECYRILRPGGIAKVFGGTRMYHRAAAAMAVVGFVDIHQEAWGYGNGFPKSHNVSVAIDKHLGNERELIATEERYQEPSGLVLAHRTRDARVLTTRKITRSLSEEGRKSEGWGTALKPAWEPFIVGRKP